MADSFSAAVARSMEGALASTRRANTPDAADARITERKSRCLLCVEATPLGRRVEMSLNVSFSRPLYAFQFRVS